MAILAGGLALAGGALSFMGSNKAADKASASNEANLAFQRDIYNRTLQNLHPYRNAGEAGLDSYMERLGYTNRPIDIRSYDPAIDWANKFISEQRQSPIFHAAAEARGKTQAEMTAEDVFDIFGGDTPVGWDWAGYGKEYQDLVAQAREGEWVGDENVGRFTLEDLVLDPGYQFRLNEGIKNMDLSASAQGMNLAGSTLKGLNRFNQNLASTEFQNAFNRNQVELSNLWGLAGMGQNSAAGANMALQNLGQAGSNFYNNQGQIGAASAMAPFNAISSGINTGMGIYGMQQYGNYLSGLNQTKTPTSSGTVAPTMTWDESQNYWRARPGIDYGFGGGG